MKLLIIKDEKLLAESIATYLKQEQYNCEFASTFDEAIEKTGVYEYDCILLDLNLPDGEGLEILEALKKESKQDGVIIISARDAVDDKIIGLKLGADDYLPKPFHLSELSARIYSVIRRRQFSSTNHLEINELSIDLLAKEVRVNNQVITLTKKEYDLLIFLIGNKNRIVSKVALAEHLSGDMADMLDNVDFVYAHVKNLKKKLADAGCDDYIKTVYKMGYKWDV
jgi:DNA-binding response OmpR family regulator